MSKKKETAILIQRNPKGYNGKEWSYEVRQFEVTVMARVGIHAMVRVKGRIPFVALAKDLSAVPTN